MSLRLALVVALLALPANLSAHMPGKGRLLIAGGGSIRKDADIFKRLVEYAGGASQAQIAVIPTASLGKPEASGFIEVMAQWKVPAEQIYLVDLTTLNAKTQAFNPEIVERLRSCNGVYFQGGVQSRIMAALVQEGKETPVLAAIRDLYARGGVIAGSSAGAAVQSAKMISVAGLPIDSMDEGMDALDFGVTQNGARRGLLLTEGLGFFTGGIIDQHFNQYRGRLGRLTRAACEADVPYGFGIDEQTALDVAPDGSFEVIGEGIVTVVDVRAAKCTDGPLGCAISNARLSCLKHRDRFDPARHTPIIDKAKVLATPGTEAFNGNFIIPDISARGAMVTALYMGLAANTAQRQVGITLKHHGHSAHGYRYTFQKTADTQYLEGALNDSFLNVQLDIEPIDALAKAPDRELPRDLPDEPGVERTMLTTLWRRGILLEDEQRRLRPTRQMTRGDMAELIAQTIRLELPRGNDIVPVDVPSDAPELAAIRLVVANQFLEVDPENRFRPQEPITREEAATLLVQLAERYQQQPLVPGDEPVLTEAEQAKIAFVHRDNALTTLRLGLLKATPDGFLPEEPLTRLEAAAAIYSIIGFRWSQPAVLATPDTAPPMLGMTE